MLSARPAQTCPKAASQLSPARMPEAPRPRELQTPPTSSTKARLDLVLRPRPTSLGQNAANKTSSHRRPSPTQPCARLVRGTPSARTMASPPRQNPVSEPVSPCFYRCPHAKYSASHSSHHSSLRHSRQKFLAKGWLMVKHFVLPYDPIFHTRTVWPSAVSRRSPAPRLPATGRVARPLRVAPI